MTAGKTYLKGFRGCVRTGNWQRKPQISPLHYALSKNISKRGPRNCRSLHGTPGQVGFAPPDFLWKLVALTDLMRLSLRERRTRNLVQCRAAGNPGRDDKGKVGFPVGIGCTDPRSQKRDLGHPSIVADAALAGTLFRVFGAATALCQASRPAAQGSTRQTSRPSVNKGSRRDARELM
jgi:hypothetical protein